MEHTPEPWEVAQFGDDGNGFTGYQVWNRADGEVCIIRIAVNQHHDAQYANFVARCEANAHLIAAAPELLSALEAVTKVIIESGWCHCGARVAAPLGPHATDCAHEQARAAIKAAKGDA